ncbi:hypothetical protein NLG97_g8712 [Lecanicillium saksenae]|uniref:Uncharacterized protein n=1 Tax=Lecanicillium saksenae TaxID=468837 RepID=A0ACC1QJI3_9HYPO|nr:hypothetical protein NLG97_g8712 [Lecanicillium saksenae]
MKRSRPAYSVRQDAVPDGVLKKQAKEIGALLHEVDIYPDLPEHPNVSQQAQKENASLAIALANAALSEQGRQLSADDIELGIASCAWPGRFQHLHKDGVHWFLDSAHNELSIPVAISWFDSLSKSVEKVNSNHPCRRILIFGHSSDRSTERLVDVLLESSSKCGVKFDQVILSSYNRYDIPIPESVANEQLEFWQSRNLLIPIQHAITADVAINMVKTLQKNFPDTHFQVLVTGSAHLVGQSLGALGGEELVLIAP